MSIILGNRLYTRSHEWVAVENGLARIGITDYAQSELGDLVFAEAVPAGRKVVPGQIVGAVESVKIAADILSPVTGDVVESWPDIGDCLEKISTDPFGIWFVAIRLDDPGELAGLMDAAAYESFCAAGG
jgi:glycine cleavage system H protein